MYTTYWQFESWKIEYLYHENSCQIIENLFIRHIFPSQVCEKKKQSEPKAGHKPDLFLFSRQGEKRLMQRYTCYFYTFTSEPCPGTSVRSTDDLRTWCRVLDPHQICFQGWTLVIAIGFTRL